MEGSCHLDEPRAWDTGWQVFAIPKSRDVISTPLSCVARRTRVAFYFPPPFATQPAARSSECSLWPTVSYHHRKCPCHTGTDYGTEIWITIARWCDVAWRGVHAHTLGSVTISKQKQLPGPRKRTEPEILVRRGSQASRRPLLSLGGAASPRLMEHKNILIC